MKTEKINDLKNRVIDLIRETLNGNTKSLLIMGDEFFSSFPIRVPHDSIMLEVRFEMTVTPSGISIQKTEDPFEWEMDEGESEDGTISFLFSQLTLHQLTFILEYC